MSRKATADQATVRNPDRPGLDVIGGEVLAAEYLAAPW